MNRATSCHDTEKDPAAHDRPVPLLLARSRRARRFPAGRHRLEGDEAAIGHRPAIGGDRIETRRDTRGTAARRVRRRRGLRPHRGLSRIAGRVGQARRVGRRDGRVRSLCLGPRSREGRRRYPGLRTLRRRGPRGLAGSRRRLSSQPHPRVRHQGKVGQEA